MFTEWLKDRKKRIYISVLAGMAASILTVGMPKRGQLAWWGTMYPEFCFSDVSNREENEKPQEGREVLPVRKVKISFRLAKALDW